MSLGMNDISGMASKSAGNRLEESKNDNSREGGVSSKQEISLSIAAVATEITREEK